MAKAEKKIDVPIRILRARGIAAGARIPFDANKKFIRSEIVRLGEDPDRAISVRSDLQGEVQTHSVSADSPDRSFCARIDLNGDFTLIGSEGRGTVRFPDLDQLIANLIYFRDEADAGLEAVYQQSQDDKAAKAKEMEAVADFDGTPPPLTPEDQSIVDLARKLGILGGDFGHCLYKVAEAYDLPFGVQVNDENGKREVMFPVAEMKAHVLKAMEKPLE